MNKMLTVAEAAAVLHVSETTVRALCSARKIRHERHGMGRGKILIPDDALGEYRASVTVRTRVEREEPPPPAPNPGKLRNLSLN